MSSVEVYCNAAAAEVLLLEDLPRNKRANSKHHSDVRTLTTNMYC